MSCDSDVLHSLALSMARLYLVCVSSSFDFNIFYRVLLITLSLSEKVSIVELVSHNPHRAPYPAR